MNVGRSDDTAGSVPANQSLRLAVRDVKPIQRGLLSALYGHGMTVDEAATHFDIPVGTVRSRALHALRAGREALAAKG